MSKTAKVVIVDYEDLQVPAEESNGKETISKHEKLMQALEEAFGPNGSGIIGIANVPGFVEAKNDLLPLAHRLANLPPKELESLEDPASLYNAGWSHGKEQLKKDQPDWAKGSFYFNPIVDVPGTPEDREKYPVSYPINKWPDPKTSSLPELEPAAKKIGQLMRDVAVDLSVHIDTFAHSKNPSYNRNTLSDALADTIKVKGRLLYYFPLPSQQQNDDEESTPNQSPVEDSWIGWHNDSGFLTALAGDLYIDPTTGQPLTTPPADAGLYVMNRSDHQVVKVEIPPNCMAIQMGECTQILTGGSVVATPHCVRGAPNIARASLACFIDTPPQYPLSVPSGLDRESVIRQQQEQNSNSQNRIPSLESRWTENGMTFGYFLQQTFQMYYDWTNK